MAWNGGRKYDDDGNRTDGMYDDIIIVYMENERVDKVTHH